MAGYLGARQSVLHRLTPLTLSRISVGFALIAALWLLVASVHGEVIAGVAAAARLHPAGQLGLAGNSLSGTFVANLGGAGTAGVWQLAVIAVILTVLTPMVDLCVRGSSLSLARQHLFGPPCDVRLPL